MMKKTQRSVAVNFLYNMVYQISLVILPLITSPYLSRVIGPDGLGSYSYSHSVAYYFYLIGMLGVSNYGNRNIAAVRDDREKTDYTFSRIYYFQFITSGVATLIYLCYCLFFCKADIRLALAQILYVLSCLINVNWFFFGIEDFRITVVRKTAIKIITSACVFIFVKSLDDLLLYALVIAAAEFLGELYLWYYIPKYTHFRKVPMKEVLSGAKEIIILFIPIIATSVYRYMDKIMLGNIRNMNDVGQYDYAEKIIMICLGCMTALGTVMLPKMANLISNGKTEEMKKNLINSMRFAMFMACGITFGLSAVAERLAIVYFGSEYHNCGLIMLYLSVTVIPIAWANVVRTQYLIPSAKDKEFTISVLVGAALNFTINYLLIPTMGIIGAVIGTIIAEFSVAIIQTFFVRKDLDIAIYLKNTIPFLIAGVVMHNITRVLGNVTNENVMGLIIQVLTGFTIYVFLTGVYYLYTRNIYQLVFKEQRKK